MGEKRAKCAANISMRLATVSASWSRRANNKHIAASPIWLSTSTKDTIDVGCSNSMPSDASFIAAA